MCLVFTWIFSPSWQFLTFFITIIIIIVCLCVHVFVHVCMSCFVSTCFITNSLIIMFVFLIISWYIQPWIFYISPICLHCKTQLDVTFHSIGICNILQQHKLSSSSFFLNDKKANAFSQFFLMVNLLARQHEVTITHRWIIYFLLCCWLVVVLKCGLRGPLLTKMLMNTRGL